MHPEVLYYDVMRRAQETGARTKKSEARRQEQGARSQESEVRNERPKPECCLESPRSMIVLPCHHKERAEQSANSAQRPPRAPSGRR